MRSARLRRGRLRSAARCGSRVLLLRPLAHHPEVPIRNLAVLERLAVSPDSVVTPWARYCQAVRGNVAAADALARMATTEDHDLGELATLLNDAWDAPVPDRDLGLDNAWKWTQAHDPDLTKLAAAREDLQ